MSYQVFILHNEDEFSSCPLFQVDRYNWGGDYRPVTYGRLGFLPSQGFLLEMECLESNPCRTYTQDGDDVYLDSAMEAFFCFAPQEDSPIYLNFEMNANGALLACYGPFRKNRFPFPESMREGLSCEAEISEDRWKIRLRIPLTLLNAVYPNLNLTAGSCFTCNFYKIKESEGLTHFASYTEIRTPGPDFHQPAYFAQAVLCNN